MSVEIFLTGYDRSMSRGTNAEVLEHYAQLLSQRSIDDRSFIFYSEAAPYKRNAAALACATTVMPHLVQAEFITQEHRLPFPDLRSLSAHLIDVTSSALLDQGFTSQPDEKRVIVAQERVLHEFMQHCPVGIDHVERLSTADASRLHYTIEALPLPSQ